MDKQASYDAENGLLYVYIVGSPDDDSTPDTARTELVQGAQVNVDFGPDGEILGFEVIL